MYIHNVLHVSVWSLSVWSLYTHAKKNKKQFLQQRFSTDIAWHIPSFDFANFNVQPTLLRSTFPHEMFPGGQLNFQQFWVRNQVTFTQHP